MNENYYLKTVCYLLLSIIPLSIVGYFFAVSYESLFFLFEWLLFLIVVIGFIVSIIGSFKSNGNSRWVLISTVAFLCQFTVLSLFLGPFTFYGLFYLFYIVTLFALIAYVVAIIRTSSFRFLPIVFTIFSLSFTVYMGMLNSLWGKDLS
ncbi:hypothetical protein [Alkalihalobacillus sp. AL-G]|uniref:hypothetical protein n=1 Tax=Alkalihalobacillus sp. AL-G TaxID=2926399 RepID=UPI00272D0DA4|nr:hypothetical protein [Alkalihalobacillus sp. AL-G]WLD91740.1 hypothetical protein MOJ78_11875 [Alkalihalobacillus sp. AL-G]